MNARSWRGATRMGRPGTATNKTAATTITTDPYRRPGSPGRHRAVPHVPSGCP